MIKDAVINLFLNKGNAEKGLKDIRSNVKSFKAEVIVALGAFGGVATAVGAIKSIYTETKKLADFSEMFSLPVEEVSKFVNKLSLFGASTDTAIDGLKALQQGIIDLRTRGDSSLKDISAIIGLEITQDTGAFEIWNKLREKFSGLNENAQLKVTQELGIADPAMLRMLRASKKEYQEMTNQAFKMFVINKQTADRVQKLDRILKGLKNVWHGFGAGILGAVLEPLDKINIGFAGFEKIINKNEKVFRTAILGMIALGSTFLGLIIAKTLIWAASTIIAIGPYLLIVAAIVAAIYSLSKLSKWLGLTGDFWKGLGNIIKDVFEKITPFLLGIMKFILSFYKILLLPMKMLFKLLEKLGVAGKIKDLFGDFKAYVENYGKDEENDTNKEDVLNTPQLPTEKERQIMAETNNSQTTNSTNNNNTRNNITININGENAGNVLKQLMGVLQQQTDWRR